MSEAPIESGAGALLRAARQKQGLHIAALAASIKVSPAKLEALESGRYDELPDATFTRALAQSVCRALKIDAQPVLAQLPSSAPAALDRVDAGLNAPFRERPTRVVPAEWLVPRQPAAWLALLLVVGAAAMALMPGNWFTRWLPEDGGPGPEGTIQNTPAGGVGTRATPPTVETVAAPVPAAVVTTPPSAAVPVAELASGSAGPSASAALPSAAAASAASQLTARQATWVQVADARGQVLLARTLQPGEVIDLSGERPLRLRIGNVRGTELVDRGQPIDLASRTRDNVLNIELP